MKPDSISNRKLTLLRKLNQKKYRQKKQLFLVEGERAVRQVIENEKVVVEHLFFDNEQEYWTRETWHPVLNRMPASVLTHQDFSEVSDTDNPQGMLAMCKMPIETDLETLASSVGIIIATDALQDPGNLGTIIRTAAWFGVQSLLSGKGTVDLFHPKVVRSTAGATGTVPHANVELTETLPAFEQAGWSVVMLDAGPDAIPLKQIKKEEKMLLVIGNEAHGISPHLFKEGRQKVRIAAPRNAENVESLNAAIATAIGLYALSDQ